MPTTQFLAWCCVRLAARGKTALLLVWDDEAWCGSKAVVAWVRAHNRAVRAAGRGVRIVGCPLPFKSPWRNPIEPTWLHATRRAAVPGRLLTARETAEHACATLRCDYEDHLTLPQEVA